MSKSTVIIKDLKKEVEASFIKALERLNGKPEKPDSDFYPKYNRKKKKQRI